MFETIIVPLDGSEMAEAALPSAKELTSKFGATLILLRAIEDASQRLLQTPAVLEPPAAAAVNVEIVEQIVEADRQEAQAYLSTILQGLGLASAEAVVAEGDPADAISQVAEQRGAGLIIMSSHGRGGLGRLLHGSIADAVLRHGNVPVLLIRVKHKD